jgi:hypothetical protein
VARFTQAGLRWISVWPPEVEMKRCRLNEHQIIGILKEHEAGESVVDLFCAAARDFFHQQVRPCVRTSASSVGQAKSAPEGAS